MERQTTSFLERVAVRERRGVTRALDWDVVMRYAPPWSGPTRFSKHHLANYLAQRGARVLYVESPLSPFGIKRGKQFIDELERTAQPPRPMAERLWVRR